MHGPVAVPRPLLLPRPAPGQVDQCVLHMLGHREFSFKHTVDDLTACVDNNRLTVAHILEGKNPQSFAWTLQTDSSTCFYFHEDGDEGFVTLWPWGWIESAPSSVRLSSPAVYVVPRPGTAYVSPDGVIGIDTFCLTIHEAACNQLRFAFGNRLSGGCFITIRRFTSSGDL